MDAEELAANADEMFALAKERSRLKKAFDKSDNRLKERHDEIGLILLEALGKPKGVRSLKTDNVTATYKMKKVFNPKSEKWDEIYKYIVKNEAWDFLSKKLSSKAVELRFEAGEDKALRKLVEPFQKKSISLTVVK